MDKGFNASVNDHVFVSFIHENTVKAADLGQDVLIDLYTVVDASKLALVSQMSNKCYLVSQTAECEPILSIVELQQGDLCQIGAYSHLNDATKHLLMLVNEEPAQQELDGNVSRRILNISLVACSGSQSTSIAIDCKTRFHAEGLPTFVSQLDNGLVVMATSAGELLYFNQSEALQAFQLVRSIKVVRGRLSLVLKDLLKKVAYLVSTESAIVRVSLETGSFSLVNWLVSDLAELKVAVQGHNGCFIGLGTDYSSFEIAQLCAPTEDAQTCSELCVYKAKKQVRRILQLTENLLVVAIHEESVEGDKSFTSIL